AVSIVHGRLIGSAFATAPTVSMTNLRIELYRSTRWRLAIEPAGRARGRRAAHEGPQAGHGRHHRAAQGHHVSDRRPLAAGGDPGAQSPRPQARNTTATVLSGHRQAGRDDGRALRPRQAEALPLHWLRVHGNGVDTLERGVDRVKAQRSIRLE